MPKPALQVRLDKLKYKLQEAQPKKHENLLLRKRMVEKAYAQQIHSERNDVASRMQALAPGPKRVFLQARLQKLNQMLK